MNGPKVSGIRGVEFGVADLASSAAFYTGVWGLDQVAADGDAVYLRGTGPYNHVLTLRRRKRSELVRITFDAPDRKTVDAIHARLGDCGASDIEDPGEVSAPGGGYGFGFVDPDGRNAAIVTGVDDREDRGAMPDRPYKVTHVVLNADGKEGNARAVDFYCSALGFRVSDRINVLTFLTCSPDHHSLAFGFEGGVTLNHVAFDMIEWENVMRGAGRLAANGCPMEWGVGRHGPGNNLFAYFVGPGDFAIEYTAEVQQIDDSYRPGTQADWQWPPGRLDYWGLAGFPSERLSQADSRIPFAEDEWRLRG